MKAKLLNHINVGMLNLIGDCGHDISDEEVNVLCGPFVTTIGNSPMLAWYLCETEDDRRFYIEATNLQEIKPSIDDWMIKPGKIFFESVDWSSFRREAAKEILAGMLSNPEKISIRGERLATIEGFVNAAIEITDELIRQIKEK